MKLLEGKIPEKITPGNFLPKLEDYVTEVSHWSGKDYEENLDPDPSTDPRKPPSSLEIPPPKPYDNSKIFIPVIENTSAAVTLDELKLAQKLGKKWAMKFDIEDL